MTSKLSSRFAPIWADGCQGWFKMNKNQRTDERSSGHQAVIDLIKNKELNLSYFNNDILESAELLESEIKNHSHGHYKYDVTLGCDYIHKSFECIIDFYSIYENTLTIIKYEHSRVSISPKENLDLISQTISLDGIHNFENVKLIIVQPRSFSEEGAVKTWITNIKELSCYVDQLIRSAELCFSSNVQTKSGPHCSTCFSRHECSSAIESGVKLFEVSHHAKLIELTPDQIGLELKIVNRAIESLKTLKTAFESQIEHILSKNKSVSGWELKKSYGRETWSVDKDIIMKMNTDVNLLKSTLITPSQARKLGFDTSGMTIKPDKGMKLTPSKDDASEIFSD